MRIVAILSYIIFVAGFYFLYKLERKKLQIHAYLPEKGILYVLGSALLLRLIAAPLIEGFSSDMNLFRFWSQMAAKDLTGLYDGNFFLDYPPFYMYFLFVIGKIAGLLGLQGGEPLYILLLKLPSISADLITGYLLYRLAKNRLPGVWPLIVCGIYVFNPAVIIDSTIWGQVDSFLVMFLALGFIMLNGKRPELSALPFAAAILVKPQGLIFLPVVLFELLKRKDIKLLLKTAVYGILTVIIVILPFAIKKEPSWIFNLYFNTTEGYKYASLNAFNFFSLIGHNLTHDSDTFILFSFKTWGFIFIFAAVIYTGILYFKGKGSQLVHMGALVLSLGVFMLSVRMHERYMFPVLFFLLVIFILTRDKWSLIFYGVSSFTVFVNIFDVLDRMIKSDYPHVPPNDKVLLLISLINMLLFMGIVVWAWLNTVQGKVSPFDLDRLKPGRARKAEDISSTETRLPHYIAVDNPRLGIIAVSVMTAVYLAVAFINLGSTKVPETEWAAKSSKDGFIIQLDQPRQLSRLNFYSGLGHGTYKLWYLDADGAYQRLEDIKVDDFYKWQIHPITAKTTRLKVQGKEPGGMLKELALFEDQNRKPLPIEILDLNGNPVVEGELLNLADEQGIAQYRQSYMNSTYFDEIYHARTAYEHLHRIKPYEWTHPPLGKILISIGISIFGMNPFGWRIIGTLFGAAMIPMMYLFGKKLFRKSFYGFCAAFLMMFDLMHFAQTRIATIDGYTTFFVILMYYFMTDYYLQKSYNKNFFRSLIPLFLSGIFFGLGAATKWSVLYGAPGLALIFFMAKYNEYKDYRYVKNTQGDNSPSWVKRFMPTYMYGTMGFCVLFFIVIPAAIYFLSYIPYLMVPGLGIADVFKYQKSMYNYHSKLTATHSFSSQWWSWPLIIRPIWYYQGKDLAAGMASTIASFGNPAVWWAGVLAFIPTVKSALKGNRQTILLLVAVASQYLPWMLISRAAFIYHFFPIVPFVMLAVVYAIKALLDKGIKIYYVYGYLALVMLLFIMFYPAVSALEVPKWYIEFLRWFPSWYF